MSPPRGRAAFVGREAELTQLTEAMAAAAAGSPSIVIVSADAGVGKTRLLAEFTERVDGSVLWGSCPPMGGRRLPMSPVVELLRRLQADEVAASRIPPALMPLLSPREDDRDAPSVGRSQLFQAVLDLLEALAAESPTVVMLEDLHWADQSTGDLLTFLLPNLRTQRLLLIVSYRADGLPRDDPMRAVLAEIVRYPHLRRLELAPFTIQQVAAQVELLTGERPSREVVDLVFARTQGNAYFVEELVAAYGHQGGDLPASLRDVLLVRASGVSPAARRLMDVASLAVTDIGESLLADVVNAPMAEVRQQLHELVDAHLLVTTSTGVTFRHALMQEAMQARLLPGERREYHAAYATALRSRTEDGASNRISVMSQIAYHLQEAGRVAEAMSAWVAAAGEAEAVSAFAEAHYCLANALAGWELVNDPVDLTGSGKLELLARAAEDASHGGDAEAATGLVRQALDLVDETADPVQAGMLYERLRFYQRLTPEREQGAAAMERAMQLVPEKPPSVERAHVLAGYAGEMLVKGRLHEAREASRQAVEMARLVDTTQVECRALNSLGVTTCFLEDDAKGLAQIEAALDLAISVSDPYQQMRGQWNLFVCASESGRWEQAILWARRGIAELPRLGYGHLLPELYSYLQEYFLRLGRFKEARAVADEAAARFPTRLDEAISAELLIAVGDFDAARRAVTRPDVAEDDEIQIELAGRLADLEAWLGNTEAARDALDKSLRRSATSDRPGARGYSLMSGIRCEADVADRLRSRRDSRELQHALERGQRHHDLMVELMARPGPSHGWRRELGVVAAICAGERTRLLGTPDPSAWTEAVAAADALSMGYLRAYAELRLAEAIVASGGDRDEAARCLRHVHKLTTGWGTRPLGELTERLATRARIDIGTGTPPPVESKLTSRERQVLDLIARGASNRQISDELFISEKTTSVHVSNILRKLGVSSRGEAASLAYEKGWAGF